MISDVKGASSKFVQDTLTTLKDRFNDHFESGLLQVSTSSLGLMENWMIP